MAKYCDWSIATNTNALIIKRDFIIIIIKYTTSTLEGVHSKQMKPVWGVYL